MKTWTRNAVELGSFTTGARQRQFLWRFAPDLIQVGRFAPGQRVETTYFLAGGFAGVEAVA